MALAIYLDEDAARRALVRALEARGMDVLTAVAAGRTGASASLRHQGRALFSYNIGDYLELHSALLTEGKTHAGLILAPQQGFSIGDQVRLLLRISSERQLDDMRKSRRILGKLAVILRSRVKSRRRSPK